MSVALSCPATRQSRHYLPADALPYWCEVRPVAAGSALLLRSPPCCHGLSLVVAGCLGNGRLHQQWACTSVGVDYLGNGGYPSPTELHRTGFSCALREPLHRERLKSPFCLSHCATPNAVSLESPGLAHCPSPIQSQVQPSQVSDCQFNRAPRTTVLCAEHCVAPLRYSANRRPHWLSAAPAKTAAWHAASLLYLGISPFFGQQRSVWKCVPDSSSPFIRQELQSWVVLTVPS